MFAYFWLICLSAVVYALYRELAALKRVLLPGPAKSVEFYEIKPNGQKVRVEGMENLIGIVKKYYAVKFKDDFGNEAAVDGAPQWSLTDDTLGVLTVGVDGIAMLETNGKAGDFKLQLVADADLGEGRTEIFGEKEFRVLSGNATVVELVEVAAPVIEEPAPEEPVEETPVEEVPTEGGEEQAPELPEGEQQL